ncbi:hypothetical protein VPHD51_0153 [Vibrio phage D51]
MTEQSNEKFLWIFRSGHRDHSWARNHEEDYSDWYLPTTDLMTEDQAIKESWEIQCDTASGYGDPDYTEECEECGGSGEDEDGETCQCCGGEGEVDMDEDCRKEAWAQYVEENSFCYMEKYNPEIHFAVKSEFPEHLAYAHEKAMKDLASEIDYADRELEQLRREMRRIGKRIDATKAKRLEANLKLTKLENQ